MGSIFIQSENLDGLNAKIAEAIKMIKILDDSGNDILKRDIYIPIRL